MLNYWVWPATETAGVGSCTASGGGGSWHATNAYGATASGGYNHYYGGYYGGYHPPTVVNSYSTGCYNCGGWNTGGAAAAGLGVGLLGGAIMGAAATSAATTNAYKAGVAAGTASASTGYALGNIYPALPAGCTYRPQGSTPEYSCTDGVWFAPSYVANGVYYRVIPAP